MLEEAPHAPTPPLPFLPSSFNMDDLPVDLPIDPFQIDLCEACG